jgi:putative membrane protein
MHGWFNGGHVIWMMVSSLVAIGLFSMLVWLVVVAFSGPPPSSYSPEDLLRRRYARGEIDNEEYERRLDELRKTRSAA